MRAIITPGFFSWVNNQSISLLPQTMIQLIEVAACRNILTEEVVMQFRVDLAGSNWLMPDGAFRTARMIDLLWRIQGQLALAQVVQMAPFPMRLTALPEPVLDDEMRQRLRDRPALSFESGVFSLLLQTLDRRPVLPIDKLQDTISRLERYRERDDQNVWLPIDGLLLDLAIALEAAFSIFRDTQGDMWIYVDKNRPTRQ